MSMSNGVSILFDCISLATLLVMGYLGFVSLYALVSTQQPLISVGFPFIWGNYQPYSYQVLIFVAFYFVFYRKFKWLSPFVLMFIWGFNDIFYNAYFDFFHFQAFIAGQFPTHIPNGWNAYLKIMGIEFGAMLIGAIALRLRFDLKYSLAKYASLIVIIANILYVAFGWSILPSLQANNTVNQWQALISTVALLLFMYTAIVPWNKPPEFEVITFD